MTNQEQVSGGAVKGSGEGFVQAGTPESEALHVEGSYFAAHHIGGTTWRFGSGDEASDVLIGTITLAPHGATTYGLANARWIVNALDQVKRQAKEDERRRIDGLLDGMTECVASDFHFAEDGERCIVFSDDQSRIHTITGSSFVACLETVAATQAGGES